MPAHSDAPPAAGQGWAYAGAILGGLVSIAANVAHSYAPPGPCCGRLASADRRRGRRRVLADRPVRRDRDSGPNRMAARQAVGRLPVRRATAGGRGRRDRVLRPPVLAARALRRVHADLAPRATRSGRADGHGVLGSDGYRARPHPGHRHRHGRTGRGRRRRGHGPGHDRGQRPGHRGGCVAERAKAKRKAVVTNARRAEAEKTRDLLADLAEVLGPEPVRAADIPALLRDLAPKYKPYASITGVQVREQFGALGVKVPSTGNRYPVDPAEVRKALALRPVQDEA